MLPVGVATTRSSTTSSGHSAAALPRTAATSAATSALLASTGCCTRQQGCSAEADERVKIPMSPLGCHLRAARLQPGTAPASKAVHDPWVAFFVR